LRTNHSDDDLVCKEKVEPVQTHKSVTNLKSIIKPAPPKPDDEPDDEANQNSPAKSEGKHQPQMAKSSPAKFVQAQKQVAKSENRPKSELAMSKPIEIKGKNEPLVIYDALEDDDDDEKVDTPVVETKSHQENKEKLIEEYNSGATTQKYFVPKREVGNRTDPGESNKFSKPNSDSLIKSIGLSKGINQTQKFIVKKADEKVRSGNNSSKESNKLSFSKVNASNQQNIDDSQNTSQKDVIVRRIKKKSEGGNKAASHSSLGFGHKKSNSEMIPDTLPKKESFKDIKKFQNSVNFDPNGSVKRPKQVTREFRSQHYKKALDKFENFKKEQQMIRKNTPITKFRKSSAKKRKTDPNKMPKPKSLGMMNTQPLNNFSSSQNYNRMYPDRHSAMSLQIGGGTYAQYANKRKARLGQKIKNVGNMDNMNIRYTKYHQIYANKANVPVKAIQKKNEKITNNRIANVEDIARGRKEGKRQPSSKRKTVSSHAKRPISPNLNTFYGKIGGMEQNNFMKKGPSHNKFLSATNGFDVYKGEKVYANNSNKSKSMKRPSSKKQTRIRSASPAQSNPSQMPDNRMFINVMPSHIGVTGNKMKLAQTENAQKISSAIAAAKKGKPKKFI
jgi:hypothetical protein